MTLNQTFLNVYVLWHPKAKAGQRYADSLFTMLSWNADRPFAREIGIPTFFRSVGPSMDECMPASIDLNGAKHTVVVALTESYLVDDQPWVDMLAQLRVEVDASKGQHEVMIVPIDGNGGNCRRSSCRGCTPSRRRDRRSASFRRCGSMWPSSSRGSSKGAAEKRGPASSCLSVTPSATTDRSNSPGL